jgi:hypothetical protein
MTPGWVTRSEAVAAGLIVRPDLTEEQVWAHVERVFPKTEQAMNLADILWQAFRVDLDSPALRRLRVAAQATVAPDLPEPVPEPVPTPELVPELHRPPVTVKSVRPGPKREQDPLERRCYNRAVQLRDSKRVLPGHGAQAKAARIIEAELKDLNDPPTFETVVKYIRGVFPTTLRKHKRKSIQEIHPGNSSRK